MVDAPTDSFLYSIGKRKDLTITTKERDTTLGKRIRWLDNLQTIAILLVMLYHAGGVYEAARLLGWFWIVDGPNTVT